jgi:hypothetical protein
LGVAGNAPTRLCHWGIFCDTETLHKNYGTLYKIYGTMCKNYGTFHKNYGTMRKNYGTLHKIYGMMRKNYETFHKIHRTFHKTYETMRKIYGKIVIFTAKRVLQATHDLYPKLYP